MIEGVEGVCPKLQVYGIMQSDQLTCADIPIVDARPGDDIRP